jgi:hypothetical protein
MFTAHSLPARVVAEGKGVQGLPIQGVRAGELEIVAYADGSPVARTRVLV